MSDQVERYPYIDEALEFRTKDGKVWGHVPWPAVHTCALPPGWVTITYGCPAEILYQGPFPTAKEIWQRFGRGHRDVSHDGRWGRRGVRR